MIGILLLFVALWSYFVPRYRWFSYFLYVSFMCGYNGGFGLWTDSVIGLKNGDLAVIYTFVVSLYLIINHKYKLNGISIVKPYKWLILFLILSVLFSLLYYQYGPYYVLQGSRSYLLLFSFPILSMMNEYDFNKLMKSLLVITVITSVLYVLQIVVGHPLMPYGDGTENSYRIDESTGLVRLYNMPTFNTFFLCLSFVNPNYFGRKINFYRIIFFAALICTLGRTGIFAGILTIGLSMFFTGKVGKIMKTALIIGLMCWPFVDIITDRFEKSETSGDIETIMRGGAATYEKSGDGGTMTYRIAWVLERSLYLIDRSLGEQIFGLGLITDSYPNMPYKFYLGLINEETGTIAQMNTPDISYGNLISNWGFGGTIVYLIFAFSLIAYLYRHRKDNYFATVAAASSIMMIMVSFAGSTLSSPKNFVIYFIIISTLLQNKKATSNIE